MPAVCSLRPVVAGLASSASRATIQRLAVLPLFTAAAVLPVSSVLPRATNFRSAAARYLAAISRELSTRRES